MRSAIAETLPNDPRLIEQAVLTRLVPYSYDWQTNGVPWYFPNTVEVICTSFMAQLDSALAGPPRA